MSTDTKIFLVYQNRNLSCVTSSGMTRLWHGFCLAELFPCRQMQLHSKWHAHWQVHVSLLAGQYSAPLIQYETWWYEHWHMPCLAEQHEHDVQMIRNLLEWHVFWHIFRLPEQHSFQPIISAHLRHDTRPKLLITPTIIFLDKSQRHLWSQRRVWGQWLAKHR